ncbi:MAG: M24 family metallopeptidase, partial [Bdellovibrionales bacterium]|nr:M24 family metallopeptidase [Bdellovibrionales bacterium]
EAFNEVRRVKDDAEVELVKKIAQIAARGYAILPDFIKAGVSERDIQLAYESEVLKAGSEKMPYDSIVGIGTNSAILHASPGSRVAKKGDLVLIDAGADIRDYCVDITRIFTVGAPMSSQQQSIFDIVSRAQTDSINLCRPGVEWRDVHLASARAIAQGLKDLNILKCSVEESLETGAVAVFFPHGVGHMVGLKVRDVGTKYNPYPKSYAGARLRVDMPLREGYMMTIEPGLYFIEALINDEETKAKFKDAINWNEISKWIHVGGVRLEDDIVIRSDKAENLTGFILKN